jgi:hypothetical protein
MESSDTDTCYIYIHTHTHNNELTLWHGDRCHRFHAVHSGNLADVIDRVVSEQVRRVRVQQFSTDIGVLLGRVY